MVEKEARPFKRWRMFVLFGAIVVIVVAFDQLTKYLVRHTLPLGGSVIAIPGAFDIHYILNNGAAFGIFQNATVYFLVIAVLMVAIILFYLVAQRRHTRFEVVTLALIASGAIGNAIDRAFMDGKVTDFIATTFMDFPVFNVADSAITIGCILFLVSLFLLGRHTSKGTEDKSDEE